ncbi:MAG: zinc metalloprotease HtpX [Solirubrobacterales bacterium]|nr:zinc metalloprotease HtpX [Solirubrobacterales bacterium]
MTTTKQSTWGATLRTTILMATLSGILVAIGYLVSGGNPSTTFLFLLMAVAMNFFSYFFSDKIALKMAGAQEMQESENPEYFQMVRELCQRAGIPMPRLYVIPQDQPNAFATGRNYNHSAVAVTAGITRLLSTDELRGVVAHELAHIKHRDILIQSVASTIGAAITYIGYMLLWFGDDNNSPLSLVASLAMVLLAPLAASIIQMAVSRQREFAADAGGAEICGNPESLASALLRLEQGADAIPMKGRVNEASEPLYIVKPFKSKGLAGLFSTHPPIEERVKRLRQMRPSL